MAAKKSLQARIKSSDQAVSRKAVKQALAKPGWRRYVPASKLPTTGVGKDVAQRRALNTRLKAPITQGSSVTERDLAHEAQAAESVQFGPKAASLREDLGVAQTRARDTGGFYDQYISQLAANRQAVADQQQATQAQLGQISSGITGLAGTEGAALQQQANQRAAGQGVAQAGDLSQLASNAAATRQALVGSFQAQQALQGAAANQYAGTLANVVGPGQKLAALAQGQGKIERARRDITDLAGQRGAWNQQYRTGRRGEEAKNVLARAALNLNVEKEKSDQALDIAKLKQTGDIAAGRRSIDRARIRATTRKAADDAAKAGSKTILSGAFQGKSQGWLATATDAQKQKLIDAYDAKHGGKGGKGKGSPRLTPGEAGSWYTQLGQLKGLAQKGLAGQPFVKGHKFPRPVAHDRGTAARRVIEHAGSDLKNPALVSAALDAAQFGFVSANSVDRLQKMGLSAQQAAQALGVPTWRQYKKTHPGGGGRPDTAGNPNVAR